MRDYERPGGLETHHNVPVQLPSLSSLNEAKKMCRRIVYGRDCGMVEHSPDPALEGIPPANIDQRYVIEQPQRLQLRSAPLPK